MRKKIVAGFFLFVVLTLLSSAAAADILLTPNSLICPNTREGDEIDCGTITLQNTNRLLGVKVQSVKVGDTENYTLDMTECAGKSLGAGKSCNIYVTFHPQSGGGFFSTVNAVYRYFNFTRKHSRKASVYGLAVFPIVRLSTNTVDFGDQTVDTSQRQYIKMENIGNDTLNVSSMTVPIGSGFSVEDDCGSSLAVDNYCGILVYFEPTETEDYVSTLEIVDDSYSSPHHVALSGSGIAAGSADINIEKLYIDFGERALDSETTETITLTSAGTVNLTITSIVASGTTFSQTNDCPATLAPDETCTVTAAFEPTTSGAYDGTITLTDNATDSPQTIRLSGKGVSPNATLSPSLINFGNQTIEKPSMTKEVILLNSGTSTLTIDDISTSESMFTQTNSCGGTLEAKEDCMIRVVYLPTETGAATATLNVTSDDPSSPAKVFLFGNGITGPDVDINPPIHDFGDTRVGETSEQQNFTIKNTGEGDLTLSSITVNSDFEQSNECPETLVEEQTCDVETAFVPAVAGNFFGILSIVDNAEGSPHKANLMGYGTIFDVTILPASINFGDQTTGKSSLAHEVRLLNSGNDTITIDSIASSSSVFAQTNDCESSLAPSAFCTISVIFTPDVIEYLTGEITITDSATGSPHNVDLTGSGIDPMYPDLDISPNFWDFGQVLVGDTSDAEEFTAKNTGVLDVIISGIDANSEFAQTNDCPETLTPDETCTISGTFSPQAAGEFTGYITVIDNTYSRYQSVLLNGAASHSGDVDISFSASSLDFGNIPINTESDVQSVILTNAGTDDVTIGEVSIAGSAVINFNMTTNCSGRSLDSGKSCIIDITFKPTSEGYVIANVMVYDDAHDSPQAITISGIGRSSSSSCSITKHGDKGPAAPALITLLGLIFGLYFMKRTLVRE